ncbi:MAG TPA: alpha-glucan family phosphorylase [Candidatus Omnitrophota bacterium]|nr:alpha-glucan family phosphorylase [Candidatus Omnitrophota bacterium]HPB68744.1 alpha-glucan family phosphorylase [Candidatus Omnitrophota bacterium]HQO58361.1 alpha-glucan family phosphorylase [Candidatus Omnitrophota bacterium]HQP11185.1 alpha-glucan family phosphorylase [Candidatus Omnitrophota bacterium]
MAYSGKKINFEQLSASIENYETNYQADVHKEKFFGFPTQAILDIENRLLSPQEKSVAYFSMEYGIAPSIYNTFNLSRPMNIQNQYFTHEVFSNYWLCDYLFKIHIDKMLDIPIYGGGLGVLAGDTIKSAADMGYAVVAIGLLWNKGYFKQNFWYKHGQVPEELSWDPYTYPGLIPLKNIVSINTQEGPLYLRLWKYYVYSYNQIHACPIVLLDSNVQENPPHFRTLTDQLYRSDEVWWKIYQRAILGIGGMKALQSLGYQISQFHLNEGHAAFALLEQYVNLEDKSRMEALKENFYFTCHTPVAAGHDRFMIKDIAKVLPDEYVRAAELYGKESPNSEQINLTYISLNNCRKVNAVAQKHGEVMRWQFPMYASKIDAITNGIHTHTWVSDSFQKLFDKYPDTFGDWRKNPENLAQVRSLKNNDGFRRDLFLAHQVNKQNLMRIIKHWRCKENIFTLGWARRIAGYKRPALMFYSMDKILELAYEIGPIQIILAGKAHPNDDIGGAHIDEILDHIDQLNDHKEVIRVMILENYDTFFGKLLTNSVDVWLNNPLPPFEASGTSGMKAILNGVLQMSTVDGWVVEAEKDDIGWLFGYRHQSGDIGKETNLRLAEDSLALKDTLKEALTLYYQTNQNGQINVQSPWIDKMIHCIEKSAFFNTQRMIQQYNEMMWHL